MNWVIEIEVCDTAANGIGRLVITVNLILILTGYL